MSSLFYVEHIDDEPYPYWIGVRTIVSVFDKTDLPEPNYIHLTEENLEAWCEYESLRGYHFEMTHDSFNGTHMRFMFLSRVDALRFLLLHQFTDKRIK